MDHPTSAGQYSPSHIHFKGLAAAKRLITQLYFAGHLHHDTYSRAAPYAQLLQTIVMPIGSLVRKPVWKKLVVSDIVLMHG